MAPLRKLTGAQARLFASVCHHYINEAEMNCNDTPDAVPLFSHLSRAQRLNLVSDVAVGMLCEDEPLPPHTVQHNSAFRAIIEILFTALEVESDMQWDHYDVGEDLLKFDEEEPRYLKRSEEEIVEIEIKNDLIEHRAERNLKKLQKGKDVGEFHVEDSQTGITDAISYADCTRELRKTVSIFEGGPVSKRERDYIRPLTEDEESAFHWRRLCDAALQEDTDDAYQPIALCNVNFDWRCQKLDKWYNALNLLLDSKLMDYGSPTDRDLVYGNVDYRSYADPSQLPRVQALKRNINLLRKVYVASWDPMLLAIDERRIFALCSTELYVAHHHKKWVIGFHEECVARGIDFKEPGKNFQARLNIFRDIKDDFMDGCEYNFGGDEHDVLETVQTCWRPSEEGPAELGFEKRMCHGPGKGDTYNTGMCWVTSNLQCCSQCKTVLYCGRECQLADWKRGHKKVCARLAKERKDKEKISQLAKNA